MGECTMYEDGTYLGNHPSWHAKDSAWKANHIQRILQRNGVQPRTVCEVGCGAGEILNTLASHSSDTVEFSGYEISPQAHGICRPKERSNLHFYLGNVLDDPSASFDVVMAIDVLEHIDDYMGFLRSLKDKGEYKVFHIPLDLSVEMVLRNWPILQCRKVYGHIHYFLRDTALAALRDTGYQVVDHFYTQTSREVAKRNWRTEVARLPRRLLFAIDQDFAVRTLGGCSLMVLAK